MRKYSAIFALILTLWGTFSPLGISIVTSTAHHANTEQKSVALKIETQKAFAGTSDDGNNDDQTNKEVDCGLTDVFCGLFKLIITLILFIPNAVTTVMGLLMDFSIWLGIHPVMYGASGLTVPLVGDVGAIITSTLRDAWGIIRDFSNILFIFALFVIAFSLILNKNLMNFEPKKAIVKVIVMALLVNFSFLFCRLVIQTSDIFSNLLYSRIEQTGAGGSTGTLGLGSLSASSLFSGGLGIKSPSLSLVSKANPQSLLANTNGLTANPNGGVIDTIRTFGGLRDVKDWEFYVTYGTIAFFAWLMYLILTFVFASIIFIFLGRIFGLWLAIILSPLAFVSYTIPSLEDNKYFGFKNWSSNLFQLAFMAPIFMFFLYISVVVINLNTTLENTISGGGVVAAVMKGLIPLFGSAFIILKGKKISYGMSGAIGEFVNKYAGMATTAALGAATGGTSMALRQTVGRAGAALANSSQGNNGLSGRGMRAIGNTLSAASFDVRNSPRIMSRFGQFTAAAGENVNLATSWLRNGGYAAEGTISEQIEKHNQEVAAKAAAKAAEDAKNALLNAQAENAKRLREFEADLEYKKRAMEADNAKIEVEAENVAPTKFKDDKAKELAKLLGVDASGNPNTLASIMAEIATEKAAIAVEKANQKTFRETKEAEITKLKAEIKAETDPAVIATKQADLKVKEDELKAHTKEENKTAKKETDLLDREDKINKANIATNLTATNVRDARQKRKDKELEAEVSAEKETMDKEKKDMEEKDTKRKEAQKEVDALNKKLENAKKTGDVVRIQEIEDELAEKDKDRNKKDDDHKKAKSKYNEAKLSYDREYGHEIKSLEDLEKDTIKDYKKSQEARTREFRKAVITAQKSVNEFSNEIANANYEFQRKYADDLEKDNPSGGLRGNIGTLTGGKLFGLSVRDAAEVAATKVRNGFKGQ